MNNFNTTRFANFGKYDLIINKGFYRNISLVTIFGSIGIATLGFLMRWNMCHNTMDQLKDMDPDCQLSMLGYLSPTVTSMTAEFIIGFCLAMLFIFAGHTFHNLRNKQGRITELTIPATNLERWTWHILASIGGGILICIVSVLCADLLNAILNLLIYRGEVNSSLSLEVVRNLFFITTDNLKTDWGFNHSFSGLEQAGIVNYARFLVFCVLFCQLAIYIFGNSLKYRYNIILTYITLQVLGTVVLIIGVLIASNINLDLYFPIKSEEEAKVLITTLYYIFCALNLIVGSLLLWGSYKKYCGAQITSRFNK